MSNEVIDGTFTSLLINFHEQNHASVFFAHLQNILKSLSIGEGQQMQFNKIDRVLFDIFQQYKKLEQNHDAVSQSTSKIIQEFLEMMNESKTDREQLLKVTEERQELLNKLKACTDDSLVFLKESEQLKQQMGKMSELNSLLSEKNQILEKQNKLQLPPNLQEINTQYQKLSEKNLELQRQILALSKQTLILSTVSIPLQIIHLAFVERAELKDEIWETVMKNSKGMFSDEEYVKNKFYSFDFGLLMGK